MQFLSLFQPTIIWLIVSLVCCVLKSESQRYLRYWLWEAVALQKVNFSSSQSLLARHINTVSIAYHTLFPCSVFDIADLLISSRVREAIHTQLKILFSFVSLYLVGWLWLLCRGIVYRSIINHTNERCWTKLNNWLVYPAFLKVFQWTGWPPQSLTTVFRIFSGSSSFFVAAIFFWWLSMSFDNSIMSEVI